MILVGAVSFPPSGLTRQASAQQRWARSFIPKANTASQCHEKTNAAIAGIVAGQMTRARLPASLRAASSVSRRISLRQAFSKSPRSRLSFAPCARESGSMPALVTRMAASGNASANSAMNGIVPPMPTLTMSLP